MKEMTTAVVSDRTRNYMHMLISRAVREVADVSAEVH